MATYKQAVAPRLATIDGPGWCLRFTQSVFGSPVMHPSAKAAWNATRKKHRTRTLPNVSVPVWFSHWGDYDGSGYAQDWGHVAVWVPGRGILTSPLYGTARAQEWYSSIAEIERRMPATYLGWTEDINGMTVVKPVAKPTKKKGLMVKKYQRRDKYSEIGNGRTLRPNDYIYLNEVNGRASSATNCIGSVGEYMLFPHMYVTGRPGDTVNLYYVFQSVKTRKNSNHYVASAVIGNDGYGRISPAFMRNAVKGTAVYLRAHASAGNKANVSVRLLASDAALVS